MDFTQVPTVVAIIVITYLIGYASKQIPQVKDNIIPIIVGVAGGILGVVGMFVIPGYPADNILDAIAVGIVSGMASTGVNQIYYTHEEIGFSEPVDFWANISFDGGEAQNKEYGFDTADFDAVLLTDRGEYPFKKGDLIWLDSEPTKDDNGLVDSTSADFTIVGVKPSLYSVKYMLKAVVKEV